MNLALLVGLVACFLVLVIGGAIHFYRERRRRSFPWFEPEQLLLFAHRGVPSRAPENTIPAFEEAIRSGVDGIELDVMETADGQLVVRHDWDLERTTDGTGYVWEHSYADIRQFNASHSWSGDFARTAVPTVGEVLDIIPASMLVNIEIKSYHWRSTALEDKVVAEVRRRGMVDRTIISSFNPFSLLKVKRLEPRLAIGFIWWDINMPWVLRRPYLLPLVRPDFLHATDRVVTPRVVKWVHLLGMKIYVWTVNNRPAIEHFKAIGADGIFTDFPELVKQVNRS
ncbi:MAG: hypothetical protein KAU50_08305 [Candidatus Marinimicrobia bacterium]|nr:hypothetical protein [Candidatus Neomarinimicrobiota bacterium]